jgi:RecA-family ATPase
MGSVDRNALALQLELEAAEAAAEVEAHAQTVTQKVDAWRRVTLADAFMPRPEVAPVVAGILQRQSISIWYGAPGVQKSLLIADLCQCVISGTRWLRGADRSGGFEVMRTSAAWLDLDNGCERTLKRFEAIARGYGIDEHAVTNLEPLHIWPLPLPLPSGKDTALMLELGDYCKRERIALLVVDNLQRISAGLDEKTNEMDSVMANLRTIAERADLHVLLIHHAVKNAGERARKGDSLRGHSSIEAAVDLAMLVTREGKDSPIRIECTKSRDDEPNPITARLHYTQKPNRMRDLKTAWFASERIETLNDQMQAAVLDAVRDQEGINSSTLEAAVLERFPDTRGARKAIRATLEALEARGELVCKRGEHNAVRWFSR